MRILVTGAAGFIGSHLCEELLNRKYKVKAFIRYNSTQSQGWLESLSHKNLEIVMGDVTDFDSVNNALSNCDYVFNLAANISVLISPRILSPVIVVCVSNGVGEGLAITKFP